MDTAFAITQRIAVNHIHALDQARHSAIGGFDHHLFIGFADYAQIKIRSKKSPVAAGFPNTALGKTISRTEFTGFKGLQTVTVPILHIGSDVADRRKFTSFGSNSCFQVVIFQKNGPGYFRYLHGSKRNCRGKYSGES